MSTSRYKSEKIDRAPLAEPITFAFSKRTAKNRLMKAAKEDRKSTWDKKILGKRGMPTKELIMLYRRYMIRLSWHKRNNWLDF